MRASATARAGTSSSYRATATTGTPAARKLAEHVESRQRNHRDARCPLITARPAARRAPAGPVHDAGPVHEPHVFAKKRTRLSVDWPIAPVSTACPTDPKRNDADTRLAIAKIQNGELYSETGWPA